MPVVSEPIATRVASSIAVDWNVSGTGNLILSLPSSLADTAWKVTSAQLTIAAAAPAPFVLRLYGGVIGGSPGFSEITFRSRTLLGATTPIQINIRNGKSVQHVSTSSTPIAALVQGASPVQFTICGIVRVSIVGAFADAFD